MTKIYKTILQKGLLIAFGIFFLAGCDTIIEERRAPLGEIWLNIDGSLYEYGVPGGTFPEDAQGYTEGIQYLSIIRKAYGEDFNNIIFRVVPFDLDNSQTPIVVENAKVTVNFRTGFQFEGNEDSDMVLTITDKTDDILTGTFEGFVRNVEYQAEEYPVKGSFKIKIERF